MGIIERKVREKERRVKEILDSARILFRTKGYVQTTMLDIAEQSELSRRTIYLYFKSKEELSYAAMEESYTALRVTIENAYNESDGNGYEKLEALKDAFLVFYHTQFEQLSFTLFFDILNQISKTEEAMDNCFSEINTMTNIVISALKEGSKDGSIKQMRDIRVTAITVFTIIQATMQKISARKEWILSSFGVEDKQIIEEMFDIFMYAVKK